MINVYRTRSKHKARQPVTMRLPPHIIAYLRETGPGWQRRMADVFEAYVARDEKL